MGLWGSNLSFLFSFKHSCTSPLSSFMFLITSMQTRMKAAKKFFFKVFLAI
ncbi:hypothetical protein Syun_004489 [Stephania yunnanensis]|uniref:Uncharacterized protein n=1 Tax=Stephania yunnanensis TaxID=152371 RepID=A0AAP0L351_9MAGN